MNVDKKYNICSKANSCLKLSKKRAIKSGPVYLSGNHSRLEKSLTTALV